MSTYEASVALHVIAVVVGFGATFAYPFIQLAAERGDRARLPAALDTILLISRRLAVPATLVVGVTGVYQAIDGPYDESDGWLVAGLVLYVAIMAFALAVVVPLVRRARDAAAAQDEETYARVRRRLLPAGAALGATVLLTVALMEVKPG